MIALHHWITRSLTCVVLTVIFISAATARGQAESDGALVDDGWRRTVDGWEHISTWQLPIASVARRAEVVAYSPALISFQLPQSPLFHPAFVALGLLALGLASLKLPATTVHVLPGVAQN